MKPIATDTSSFEALVRGRYVYVDKTALLYRLISGRDGSQFFISRPRRFGKSLMLSTLKCIFEGRRELFKGLAISRKKHDWKIRPVVHLDMSDYDKEPGVAAFRAALRSDLIGRLERESIAADSGGEIGDLFDALIKGLAGKAGGGASVVVLVDEYDHPLGGLLGDRRELVAMRRLLQGFYRTLKNNSGRIRFLMMTGVSKFAKLSVFSGLNNLTDLSMDAAPYAGLLGYTPKELDVYFGPHMAALARKRREALSETRKALLHWYDSYRFCPDSPTRVVNPIAVGKALSNRVIKEYWPRTGGADLILERLDRAGLMPSDLEDREVAEGELDVCDVVSLPVNALLYQGGYLTIRKLVERDGRRRLVLGVPNLEVRQAIREGYFADVLGVREVEVEGLAEQAREQLARGDVAALVDGSLHALYARIPSGWRIRGESEAKRYFLMFMEMVGARNRVEEPSVRGFADAVVETRRGIYVFEFKYNRSASAAVRQILARGYGEAYRADRRPVTFVGVNYRSRTRTLDPAVVVPAEKCRMTVTAGT